MKEQEHDQLINAYLTAKEYLTACGFEHEIAWQEMLEFDSILESDFLRETAWVVLSSGMRETTVRKIFPAMSDAFAQWRSAKRIVEGRIQHRWRALNVFNHPRKIDAIITNAQRILREGYETVKKRIASQGVAYLQSFDFVGPITCYHLAKNIGLNVAKPDRHLERIATVAGFETPNRLCQRISEETGDRVAVVDIVVWRFATLVGSYDHWSLPRPGPGKDPQCSHQ